MGKRRTDLKPKDFERCAKCHRLVQRTTAWRIFGTVYGPECAKKVINKIEASYLAERSSK